jgi:hypothetical protein
MRTESPWTGEPRANNEGGAEAPSCSYSSALVSINLKPVLSHEAGRRDVSFGESAPRIKVLRQILG